MVYRFLIYKIILLNADHVFVQSDQMKRDIQASGIDGQKMTVVPMGFEAGRFRNENVEKAGGTPDGDYHPRIIYLGTLISLRRIDFMIRVFSMVLNEVPQARLYLVGAGETDEDIEMLRREARNLGVLDSVVFTGFLERQKALEMVKSADVCVSPFYPTPILNSTSPTKLIEYMALGKSVVANEHPEQKQIIEDSGGGICVAYREAEFADAIVFLLKNPVIKEKMGHMGRKWVFNNRTYSIIADKVERVYYEQMK
jgi:glycosyltransferase involved in cell wall biosynthesis